MPMLSLGKKITSWVKSAVEFPTVGFDISETSVKYLKLKQNTTVSVELYGREELPAETIKEGEIKNKKTLAEVIRKIYHSHKLLHSAFALIALPEEKNFLRLIKLPKIKIDEVDNAVKWEVEANIPLPLEDLIYDYEIIEPLKDHLDHLDVVIYAVPKETAGAYTEVFKEAGIQPLVLEFESQALVRSIISNLRTPQAYIIAQIGRNKTSICIFAGGAVLFTTTIRIGGAVFEEHLSKQLGVDMIQARKIKEAEEFDPEEYVEKILPAFMPGIDALADELKKAADYYSTHLRHIHGASEKIDKILLAGGDANLCGIDTYLSSIMGIPTQRANPFNSVKHNLSSLIPPIPRKTALAYGTAMGLALRKNNL